MFVVFDLDGTLSLDHHRRQLLGATYCDHEAYHAACGGDAPNWPLLDALLAHQAARHRVEVWTGRVDTVANITGGWFGRLGIHLPYMRMRPAGDTRSVLELKRQWLLEAAVARDLPDLAYDDREDCAAVFREFGVQCLLVGPPLGASMYNTDDSAVARP